MKHRIVRNVPPGKLASHVRHEFRELLPPPVSEHVTLIVFRFNHDEKGSGVVTSKAVRQAIGRIGDAAGQRVFAFAGQFTLEARAILEQNQIGAVVLGDSAWRDEEYNSIKAWNG